VCWRCTHNYTGDTMYICMNRAECPSS